MKMKANPLGHLEAEVVWTGVSESGDALDLEKAPSFRAQVPVKKGLAAQDTFAADAMQPSSRADVEKRRMHIDSGADIKGVDMAKEYKGASDSPSKDFTADKSA